MRCWSGELDLERAEIVFGANACVGDKIHVRDRFRRWVVVQGTVLAKPRLERAQQLSPYSSAAACDPRRASRATATLTAAAHRAVAGRASAHPTAAGAPPSVELLGDRPAGLPAAAQEFSKSSSPTRSLMFFCILFNYTILRDTKDVLVVTAPKGSARRHPVPQDVGQPAGRDRLSRSLYSQAHENTRRRRSSSKMPNRLGPSSRSLARLCVADLPNGW